MSSSTGSTSALPFLATARASAASFLAVLVRASEEDGAAGSSTAGNSTDTAPQSYANTPDADTRAANTRAADRPATDANASSHESTPSHPVVSRESVAAPALHSHAHEEAPQVQLAAKAQTADQNLDNASHIIARVAGKTPADKPVEVADSASISTITLPLRSSLQPRSSVLTLAATPSARAADGSATGLETMIATPRAVTALAAPAPDKQTRPRTSISVAITSSVTRESTALKATLPVKLAPPNIVGVPASSLPATAASGDVATARVVPAAGATASQPTADAAGAVLTIANSGVANSAIALGAASTGVDARTAQTSVPATAEQTVAASLAKTPSSSVQVPNSTVPKLAQVASFDPAPQRSISNVPGQQVFKDVLAEAAAPKADATSAPDTTPGPVESVPQVAVAASSNAGESGATAPVEQAQNSTRQSGSTQAVIVAATRGQSTTQAPSAIAAPIAAFVVGAKQALELPSQPDNIALAQPGATTLKQPSPAEQQADPAIGKQLPAKQPATIVPNSVRVQQVNGQGGEVNAAPRAALSIEASIDPAPAFPRLSVATAPALDASSLGAVTNFAPKENANTPIAANAAIANAATTSTGKSSESTVSQNSAATFASNSGSGHAADNSNAASPQPVHTDASRVEGAATKEADNGAAPVQNSSQNTVQMQTQAVAMPAVQAEAASSHAISNGSEKTSLPSQQHEAAAPLHGDGSEPTAASSINTAKLMQTMGESEMRVGMHSAEFGDISIRTSIVEKQMVTQISLDHDALSQAISSHVASVQSKLGDDFGLHASIEVHNLGSSLSSNTGSGNTGSGNAGTASAGSGDAGQFSQRQQRGSNSSAAFGSADPPTAEEAGVSLAGFTASRNENRLDIRA